METRREIIQNIDHSLVINDEILKQIDAKESVKLLGLFYLQPLNRSDNLR